VDVFREQATAPCAAKRHQPKSKERSQRYILLIISVNYMWVDYCFLAHAFPFSDMIAKNRGSMREREQ